MIILGFLANFEVRRQLSTEKKNIFLRKVSPKPYRGAALASTYTDDKEIVVSSLKTYKNHDDLLSP